MIICFYAEARGTIELGPQLFVKYYGCYRITSYNGQSYSPDQIARIYKREKSFYFKDLDNKDLLSTIFLLFRPHYRMDMDYMETLEAFQEIGYYYIDVTTQMDCYHYSGILRYYGLDQISYETTSCLKMQKSGELFYRVERKSYRLRDNQEFTLLPRECTGDNP